jgi:quercetin dioxygenase-like cupin family protein
MDKEVRAYKWEDLPKEWVREGVTRCGFRGENVLMVMNWLKPGMQTKPHSHSFEQIAYIVKGIIRFHVGESVIEAGPDSILRIPPHIVHYGEPVGNETVLNLDVFSPIREDYLHLVEYQKDEFEKLK